MSYEKTAVIVRNGTHITSKEFGENMDALKNRLRAFSTALLTSEMTCAFWTIQEVLSPYLLPIPQLVGSFVSMYRLMFEEKEDSDGNGND